MGIKDLSKVIADHAPDSIKSSEMKGYFGRKIAIDASMSLYQFLIAVRQDGAQLTTADGETTSHLNGMFYRTIRMIENGIKPVYVFDGKPPEMKGDELEKRADRREENQKQLDEATEKGDKVEMDKFERRLVRVTKEQNEDCKKLLRLMGVPVIDAPGEAEAQCAELVRAGKVYATATEDMDALTFGSKILVRHLTFSEAKKVPIKEFSLDRLLKDMELSSAQFVDLCILLGCDYCPTIRGIGPKKAYELIKQHKSIENVLENIDQKKFPPPESWKFAQARKLFLDPDVANADEIDFKWTEPDVPRVIEYLCGEKNFNEDRIKNALERLQKSRKTAQQARIDAFFPTAGPTTSTEPSAAKKRKMEEQTKPKPTTKKAAGKSKGSKAKAKK